MITQQTNLMAQRIPILQNKYIDFPFSVNSNLPFVECLVFNTYDNLLEFF